MEYFVLWKNGLIKKIVSLQIFQHRYSDQFKNFEFNFNIIYSATLNEFQSLPTGGLKFYIKIS